MSKQSPGGVEWPPGFERTPGGERETNRKFDVTLARAFSDLEDGLELVGVDDYDYEFDARQRNSDKRPYSNARPDDPSFVVKWTMESEQYAVACDRYTSLRDNVRATGLYINEKRKMENRPVTTGEAEFTNLRLPSGDEDDGVVAAAPPPHEVLDVREDSPDAVVKGAARSLKGKLHPDSGGSREEFQRVVEAEEAMLDE